MGRRLLLRDRALANPLPAPPDRSGYAAASFASELAARELAAAEAAFAERLVPEALACYDRALALGADFDAGLEHRWTCLMLLGQFERAWQETDRSERNRRRLALPQDHLPPHLRRVWDGTSLRGRRVRIRCFHGLGDTLQFIRYVPLVQQIARGVCIELQDALAPLLPFPRSFAPPLPPSKLRSLEIQSSPRPPDAIEHDGLPRLEKTPPTDPLVEVELMELPYIFRTTLATIPARTPYIRLPSNAIASRRRELIDLGWSKETFNVGIVWSSGNWNRERDIPLQLLAPPLATLPRVKLFSLQRNPKSNEFPPPDAVQHRAIPRYGNPWQIIQTEREVADIVATAAAISCLDLVISVDTMVAHLAGALGRPVWLLLPFHSDWRWMHARSDSPWYPAMRLFRQAAPGDWRNVISSVAQSLREVAANSPVRRPAALPLPSE